MLQTGGVCFERRGCLPGSSSPGTGPTALHHGDYDVFFWCLICFTNSGQINILLDRYWLFFFKVPHKSPTFQFKQNAKPQKTHFWISAWIIGWLISKSLFPAFNWLFVIFPVVDSLSSSRTSLAGDSDSLFDFPSPVNHLLSKLTKVKCSHWLLLDSRGHVWDECRTERVKREGRGMWHRFM